ncbi:protein WVD2-like 7 isoform X2 [Phragmites australis]|nr:protein WVD2-like 7 isoform X2 [Phragmites australis]
MGAEPDCSPPPPPELSPEPEISGHDHRGWKADMMSALGESVSFGRFLSEPLEWGKWSAFAHNRYLEEASRQSRPGSVAQKKAFFEAHYARKRKSEADAADDDDEDRADDDDEDRAGGDGALEAAYGGATSSSVTESSCMTDEAPGEEMSGGVDAGDEDCSGSGGDGPVGVSEEVEAITDAVGPFRMDAAADELCHMNGEAHVDGVIHCLQSQEKQDLCTGNLVAADAVEKQPLKEISIVNQDITDSVKKRRLHMSSLLQKPTKFSSPPSGKKGQSSSVKRRSLLHSAMENTAPPGTDSSNQAATSVPKKRSTLTALHMSMSFTRCETGNAASSLRNIGTTIAERISQLESGSRPVEKTQPEEFRQPRKTFSRALPEIAPRTSQVEEPRSTHVTRVKEMLFGLTSPSVHQKTGITKEKERKFNNEPGFKESRQSFCFKARPLPNFYRKSKQAKESSQQ